MNTLMSVDTLVHRMASGARTVLLDVRWVLGDPHGRAHYTAGHIPGAVFVDLATELAGTGPATDGRHPLPQPQAFAESARCWGINDGDTVVAYDDNGNTAAARLWWLLRYAGFNQVSMLDGGLAAWRQANQAIERGIEQPCLGNVQLSSGHLPTAGIDEVAHWSATGKLLDARAPERYRGETEPMDPKAGHIPGALSAPTGGNLGADQRFLPADELAARFAALGISAATPVAVYCGSGVTAAHEIAALEIAGIDATLFPGSWSAWSNHAQLPVATGPEASGTKPEASATGPVAGRGPGTGSMSLRPSEPSVGVHPPAVKV
ncbi:sulfurtransferase [Paenarthrobacter sp. Z7-10]|uniref:sulfurtransferase n=1 Tax=Paenarthrobacter sp. Z7-10 TaxID=2787635 RepID=UPI0022A8D5EB|nr:sulfurtransferase [Paenarthrobacter sp. Z7-10]MCZ2402433.1 sulfurtransferase [Paenarthrobacter sp. Z7-10]